MRNKRLDILRCIAVLLVIRAHGEFSGQVTMAARVGVDLFFVLSGFLISGLLFTEYQKHGSIHFPRFFIRRSLKIYPGFYFLLLITLIYQIRFHQVAPLGRYIEQLLYVQNYGRVMWGHEWSLAVEEHFYILLPLFLLLLVRRALPKEKGDPFRIMPVAFLIVAVACLVLRVLTVMKISTADLQLWEGYRWAYATTHCRVDALFFGVFLGYLYHFRPEILAAFTASNGRRVALALLAAVLVSSCLIFAPSNRFMVTAGLTALYLGFGIILILCLQMQGVLPKTLARPCERLGTALAYIGMYSYSIYLWHKPVATWGLAFLRKFLHLSVGLWTGFTFYVVTSILVGVLLAKVLEFPVLKLRDRLFPSMSPKSAYVFPSAEENVPAAASR